ncbi:hypothetical protein HYDPIDRAFT_114743 [Hydnomerulius pinastri MD-312]|uniref:UBR-type domain-containing protein n=1 Tax=Hydnomerulius pinastri MD-312 TaxID=994086 RepID=A0A0C9W632_9AGAM|nr:hypothetical protein HYDPIDRAFT_114743 [Hydnomerulius pinastri MD-312]
MSSGPSSLNDLIASQEDLLQEAALALPHEFSRCTFSLGPIRQAVYLCLTCATPRGICSSCSIACHTDHEQVELFPKRNFRCDCPTDAIPHACTLNKGIEVENSTNEYGQNFRALFCRCSKPYDPKTERETMIQCLACEDWFHESCLNLRERPSPREPSPEPSDLDTTVAHDDDRSDTSSGLPSPLISAEDYDAFVCFACVSKIDTLRRYAGTKGAIMVVSGGENSLWRKLEGDSPTDSHGSHDDSLVDIDDSQQPTTKRPRSRSSSQNAGRDPKRPRTSASPSPCLAPTVNSTAETILNNQPSRLKVSGSSQGAGDVFLTEGWRQRWCRCSHCLPSLQAHPYLLDEEDTYEPPEDPDSGLSLEELGLRALERLPRDRTIDGIRAFNDMRDGLMEYLRPFAQEGKVVEEADVNRFFEALKESKRAQS